MTDRLDLVLRDLRCPVCGQGLGREPGRLACGSSHSFDIARQGYVNLVAGSHPGTGDDAAMVAARDRFLTTGHYDPIVRALTDQVVHRSDEHALLVDVAGGTGHYLTALLDMRPDARGVTVDLSTAALRRAAQVHPRAAAVGADVWAGLPFRDGSTDVVLSVFGPRNREEIARVLSPIGVLVTVTPDAGHLHQLVTRLDLIGVGADKEARLTQEYGAPLEQHALTYDVELSRDEVRDVVAMGPTAKHVAAAERDQRLAVLGSTTTVTVAVRISSFRPSPDRRR